MQTIGWKKNGKLGILKFAISIYRHAPHFTDKIDYQLGKERQQTQERQIWKTKNMEW